MNKISKEDFNRLLKQYKTLSAEKFEMEHEILKLYESLSLDSFLTITSDKLKMIESLRERLDIVNQEMKKTDKKILKIFKGN
jgi:prephenate dehydrogenase